MLLTARSLQIARNRSPCRAGQQRGHVAAVAATEHPDPVRVAERVAVERAVEHGEHVVDVDGAPAGARDHRVLGPDDRLTPRRVPAAAAARVGHQHDEAGGGLHLRLVEERLAVLRERAAVHVEQHGVLAARLEALGAHDPGVDLAAAVGGRNGEALPAEEAAGDGRDRTVERDDLAGCSTVDWAMAIRPPAASNGCTVIGPARSVARVSVEPSTLEPVEVRLATVLRRRRAGCRRRATPASGCHRSRRTCGRGPSRSSGGRRPSPARRRPWRSAGSTLGSSVPRKATVGPSGDTAGWL